MLKLTDARICPYWLNQNTSGTLLMTSVGVLVGASVGVSVGSGDGVSVGVSVQVAVGVAVAGGWVRLKVVPPQMPQGLPAPIS